ncbi:MAG TPA: hypothetical protein PKB09_01815 [Candidatus Saccharibacteria bacterium]|nr:hypothetical protein [Candidatus Saccharibacteria bacterium]
MGNVRSEITNNLKSGKNYKEYDKTTYECKTDDIWLTTETPITKKSTEKLSK